MLNCSCGSLDHYSFHLVVSIITRTSNASTHLIGLASSSFIWFHFPRAMTHQVTFMTGVARDVTIGLCNMREVIESVVKLTESIATHPKNLRAMCNGLETVISSEIFMNSARNCLKQVLLDKQIQKIIGVSLSGVSKVALNNTFKWKKQDEESDDELTLEERPSEREPEK
mmetsp:Transcript_28268/g.38681  ORF Transcript_28268/g.38681 Transcript_28268/m.38681 type:complete len:170 (-) Transcript_28268:56-565(-)